MRISDWSSDVCSSDLAHRRGDGRRTGTGREVVAMAMPPVPPPSRETIPPTTDEAPAPAGTRPLHGADYRPPRWLRNRHLQSILAGSPMRRMRGAYGLKRLGAVSTGHMIDGGDGVRLHGLHTPLPGIQPPRPPPPLPANRKAER